MVWLREVWEENFDENVLDCLTASPVKGVLFLLDVL